MKKTLFEYRGSQVLVTYDLGRCIHAGECVRGLPGAFDPARNPWVNPDAAGADEIRDVVMRCPSCRLHRRCSSRRLLRS